MEQSTKKYVLLYNPKAKRGKNIHRARNFKQRFETETGYVLKLWPTRSIEDLRKKAGRAYSHAQGVFALGGDGTFTEVIQGIGQTQNFNKLEKPVGFISGGTGNSFLRDFDLTNFENSSSALLQAVKQNSIIEVSAAMVKFNDPDTKELQQRIMINIWGIGLVSLINRLAQRFRAIGSMNYTIATLMRLLVHKPYSWRMVTKDSDQIIKADFINVSNSAFTGGAMKIAPDVHCTDNKLLVMIPQIFSKIGTLLLFPKIFSGEHTRHKKVQMLSVEKISFPEAENELMLLDGELVYGSAISLEVMPHWWSLYIPEENMKTYKEI